MDSALLDAETLREIFLYLYRCWAQKYLGETPRSLALSFEDGVLTSTSFVMYYSIKPLADATASELRGRFGESMIVIAPDFPSYLRGVRNLAELANAGAPYSKIWSAVKRNLGWIETHRERALYRREAYETQENGDFAIWKAPNVTRLLLQPSNGELYGYTVIRNAPKDFFFRRSRSCKAEGSSVGRGAYKRSLHRVEGKALTNFDLIYESGEVLLLHLTLAGAGYKVFPRQAPEPEPDAF